ncbi:MAG: DUF1254 domain-containing protein [Terricaulis sp.]
MSVPAKYLWAALGVAVISHSMIVSAFPGAIMGAAIERLSQERFNQWRVADRVTPLSRQIVRPSPDFAYSACPYDLSRGPISLRVAPWNDYWSLSLYADNSDNFYVVNDIEAPQGADITLIAADDGLPSVLTPVIQSPSKRGIALIRRLAPSVDSYNAAVRVAQGDICAPLVR